MSVFEMLRQGYQNLDRETEQDLLRQLEASSDENERKRLQNRLEDIRGRSEEPTEGPKQETLAEAIERQNQQTRENQERKRSIRKQVPDGRGGLADV